MSARSSGAPLWLIRWPGGFTFFTGSFAEVIERITQLHRETGLQHSASEL